ncbi:MAG: hypothetical protein JWO59_1423 [Chloroflexi bacterium]|jgi:hypothetical protein|nr:hypothetical protein [Chloroflexota bacterium]MDB5076075.1 hypothetical protein [Chloroflexota bacterium]
MHKFSFIRMVLTIGAALFVSGWVYLSHPEWFSNKSTFVLPVAEHRATPDTHVPTAKRVATATPATPRVGMTEHVDDIWVTPYLIEHSQGAHGIVPNIGDEFLVAHLRIVNRSQVDFTVRAAAFQLLDGHGQINPPIQQDFTRQRLREVQLIPGGHTEGTLIFEAPLRDSASTLVYQPDTLDPSKRKIWLTR